MATSQVELERIVKESTTASGVPLRVEDPKTVQTIAEVLAPVAAVAHHRRSAA